MIVFKIKFYWILIIEMRKFKSKHCILDSKYLSISACLAKWTAEGAVHP